MKFICLKPELLKLYDSIFTKEKLKAGLSNNDLRIIPLMDQSLIRQVFINEYSIWGLPTKEAAEQLTKLFKYNKVYDLGCGTGYLAYLVKQANQSLCVTAIDNFCTGHCMLTDKNKWFNIINADAIEVAKEIDYSTVIINWAVYNSDFCYDLCSVLLSENKSNQVIYIGEESGGCNANDKFFNSFELEELEVDWFRWFGMCDHVLEVKSIVK